MLFNEKSIKNEIFDKNAKLAVFSEVLDGIDIRKNIEALMQEPVYFRSKYLLVSTSNLDISEIVNCNNINEAFDKFPDNAISIFTIEGNSMNHDFANDDIDAIIGADSRRIQIYDLYTNKKFRNKGLTTKFLSFIPWLFGNDDYMIFLKAAASCREYPDCPTDEEIQDIVENLVKFYEKCGYVDVNHPISDFENSRMMIYVSSESDRKLIKYLLKLYEDKEKSYIKCRKGDIKNVK